MNLPGLAIVAVFVAIGLAWLTFVGPTRARVVVGLGFLGAVPGFILGAIIAIVIVLNGDVLSDSGEGLSLALVFAGCGWLIGSSIGLAQARDLPPATKQETHALLLLAGLAVTVGILTVRFEPSLVFPGDGGDRLLPALQVATLADAALLAMTFILIARSSRPSSDADQANASVSRVARVIGSSGLALGFVAVAAVFWAAWSSGVSRIESDRARANLHTVNSLIGAAQDYHEEHGSYPPDLDTALAAGGHVEQGSSVYFAGPVGERFCVRVGTENGEVHGSPPYVRGLAYPDRGRKFYVSEEIGVGDSCVPG